MKVAFFLVMIQRACIYVICSMFVAAVLFNDGIQMFCATYHPYRNVTHRKLMILLMLCRFVFIRSPYFTPYILTLHHIEQHKSLLPFVPS